jgi:WD40 repeat protein
MKAMAKKAEQRFDSMTAFAKALDDYLQTEATASVPRNRVAAVLAAMPLPVATASLPVATASLPVAKPAPPQRRPRRRLLLAAGLLGALALLTAGLIIRITGKDGKEKEVIKVDPGSTIHIDDDKGKPITKLEVPNPKPEKPSPEDEIVTVELEDLPTLRIIKGHTNTVNTVAISPDSKLLASGSSDKTIRIWEVATGDRTQRIPHKFSVTCLAFAPDGKTLAAGDSNSSITLWDVATGDQKGEFNYKDRGDVVTLLVWAPDGKTLATTRYNDGHIQLWDTATKKERVNLKANNVRTIVFSPDSATVATAGSDATILLWDAARGQEKDSLRAHDGTILTLAYLDEKRLISGGHDRTVIVWDVAKGNVLRPVLELPKIKDGTSDDVENLFVTPSGRIVSATEGGAYCLWEPGKNKPLCLKRGGQGSGPKYPTNYRVMSRDGKVIARVSRHDVYLFDVSMLSGEGK